MTVILHPERVAELDRRDAAIDHEIETFARFLVENPAELMEWLGCQQLGLVDISVVHPLTQFRASADEMLLHMALSSERVGPMKTGWIIEQIQAWLMQRPEIRSRAVAIVDAPEEV